jgi:hypothetical protein
MNFVAAHLGTLAGKCLQEAMINLKRGQVSNLSLERMYDLLLVELEDLYDAEQRLTKALPKLATAASSAKLRKAIQHHLRETEGHVARFRRHSTF